MQKDTIIVTNNNVSPVQEICVCVIDTTVEPPSDNMNPIDYNSLTPAEKTQFDDCVAMIKSKI
jgi:hypothetical protein